MSIISLFSFTEQDDDLLKLMLELPDESYEKGKQKDLDREKEGKLQGKNSKQEKGYSADLLQSPNVGVVIKPSHDPGETFLSFTCFSIHTPPAPPDLTPTTSAT